MVPVEVVAHAGVPQVPAMSHEQLPFEDAAREKVLRGRTALEPDLA